MTNLLRRAIKASTSLRLRNHLRLLVGMHPTRLRDGFPDLEMIRLSRGDVVIDVGAYVGDFSEAVLAHQTWVKIHAFEPLPKAFYILQTKLVPFGGIELRNVALGRAKGESDFFVSKFPKASSFLNYGPIMDSWGGNFSTEEVLRVPILTLSDYLREQKIGRVRLLKLDVQGYELEVLAVQNLFSVSLIGSIPRLDLRKACIKGLHWLMISTCTSFSAASSFNALWEYGTMNKVICLRAICYSNGCTVN
jgi:FkbM family methyltransferase